MKVFKVKQGSHVWIYTFSDKNLKEFVYRVHKDSRRSDVGFSLWHVIAAIRAANECD